MTTAKVLKFPSDRVRTEPQAHSATILTMPARSMFAPEDLWMLPALVMAAYFDSFIGQ